MLDHPIIFASSAASSIFIRVSRNIIPAEIQTSADANRRLLEELIDPYRYVKVMNRVVHRAAADSGVRPLLWSDFATGSFGGVRGVNSATD
jgi:hypothetical protein